MEQDKKEALLAFLKEKKKEDILYPFGDFALEYVKHYKTRKYDYTVEAEYYDSLKDKYVTGKYRMPFSKQQLDEIKEIWDIADKERLSEEDVVMNGHEELREYINSMIYQSSSFSGAESDMDATIREFDLTPITYYLFTGVAIEEMTDTDIKTRRFPHAVYLTDEEYAYLLAEQRLVDIQRSPFPLTFNNLLELKPELFHKIKNHFLTNEGNELFCPVIHLHPYTVIFTEVLEDYAILKELWTSKK